MSIIWNLVLFIFQHFCRFVEWKIGLVKGPLRRLRQSALIQAVQVVTGPSYEIGRRTIVFLLNFVGLLKVNPVKCYIMVLSKDLNVHKDILESLGISPQNQVLSVDQSDVIVVFVPIVSRAGTDIEAALQKIPDERPVVLMVFYHTFDEDYIVPKSHHAVCRGNMLTVNFLFHEERGILKSSQNTTALEKTKRFLQDVKCNQKIGWL